MDKKRRRQAALKRDKRRNRTIIATVAVVLVGIIVFAVINYLGQRHDRVFGVGNNTVTLAADGTFTARLPHGVVRTGTFVEVEDDGVIFVNFAQEGYNNAVGTIEDNVLTIPDQWDDGHGHPRQYTLR